ncbi:MAG: hypothetical protein ACI4N6_03090 [Eubacteriales bacterium]
MNQSKKSLFVAFLIIVIFANIAPVTRASEVEPNGWWDREVYDWPQDFAVMHVYIEDYIFATEEEEAEYSWLGGDRIEGQLVKSVRIKVLEVHYAPDGFPYEENETFTIRSSLVITEDGHAVEPNAFRDINFVTDLGDFVFPRIKGFDGILYMMKIHPYSGNWAGHGFFPRTEESVDTIDEYRYFYDINNFEDGVYLSEENKMASAGWAHRSQENCSAFAVYATKKYILGENPDTSDASPWTWAALGVSAATVGIAALALKKKEV